MKKSNKIFWGIILVIFGTLFALKTLDVINFDIFFDGWWTLFIIIPCLKGLFSDREKAGSFIGLCVGVLFLLSAQNILEFKTVAKLFFPIVIVFVGLALIFGSIFTKKTKDEIPKVIDYEKVHGSSKKSTRFVSFGGEDLVINDEFDGGDFTAVFGGFECNLKNAIIEHDCLIDLSVVFGGVDIITPGNVNVVTDVTAVFGGTSNKIKTFDSNRPTIYVKGSCLFGGVDIK